MRLPSAFKYHRAKTVGEALSLLGSLNGKTTLVAGGTDFIVRLKGGQTTENVVDISSVSELRYVKNEKGTLKIGALTSHNQVGMSDIVKETASVLADAETAIGTVEIRNMGTIGGNICNASPCADTVPPLMVLDSKLKISGQGNERVVPIDQFFLGPGETVLKPNELLTEIQVPLVANGSSCFIKLGRRNAFNLSVISVAAHVAVENGRFRTVRIVLGSVGPTPIRAKKVERFLVGKEPSKKYIDEAAEIIKDEIKPITDVRGSAEYRTEMSKVLTRQVLARTVRDQHEQ